jgi:cell division protein FtsW
VEKTRFLKKPKVESYVDYSLIFIILFLLAFGLVMLYSTSSYEANLDYGDSAYYFKHQLVPTLIGLLSWSFCHISHMDYSKSWHFLSI